VVRAVSIKKIEREALICDFCGGEIGYDKYTELIVERQVDGYTVIVEYDLHHNCGDIPRVLDWLYTVVGIDGFQYRIATKDLSERIAIRQTGKANSDEPAMA
jgi:hypothetical protein